MRKTRVNEETILELEEKRREETKVLLRDILDRDSLNWEQRMILINSVISYEYEQLKPKERK